MKPKCKAPGMCEGGWNKPEPLKDKRKTFDSNDFGRWYNEEDIKSAVEWLKEEVKAMANYEVKTKIRSDKIMDKIEQAFEDVNASL